MLIFVMMALGLNIVVGYAGLLDLGYVAFYAIGAYTAAWFASPHFAAATTLRTSARRRRARTSPASTSRSGSCCSSPAILTALVGVIIGLPTLRLRGDYLAIVTLGFGEIMPQIARNGDNLGSASTSRTGRRASTRSTRPGFGNTLHDARRPAGRTTSTARPYGDVEPLLLDRARALLFTVFCSLRLRDSRLGRAWIAIREDETAAAAMGVPLMRTKTWAYAIGAFFGGIAGAYYASFKARRLPGRLLLQHLGLHPLHGDPRRDGQHLGRDRRRRVPRVPRPGGACEHGGG